MRRPVVYCADIGSVRARRFGWARGSPGGESRRLSDSIEDLAGAVAKDLSGGALVALGFECPLFVPLRDQPRELTQARRGEGNRPWSAGAGCASLAIGITEVLWVVREVKRALDSVPPTYVQWKDVPEGGPGLFLWEAFVSAGGKAKGSSGLHAKDAELAVDAFLSALPDVDQANAIREVEVQSLAGAALIRSGWTDDISVLSQPCLVIRV